MALAIKEFRGELAPGPNKGRGTPGSNGKTGATRVALTYPMTVADTLVSARTALTTNTSMLLRIIHRVATVPKTSTG